MRNECFDYVEHKNDDMMVRAYVLLVMVALLAVAAGTKKANPTEGVNPGDLAPRIEFLGNEED